MRRICMSALALSALSGSAYADSIQNIFSPYAPSEPTYAGQQQAPQAVAPEWNRFGQSRIDRERAGADHGISRRIAKARGGNAERCRVEPLQHSRT